MIFVVLGTQKFQLNRLLKLMDEYVEIGKIKEEVIAQRGNSDYVPKNFRSFDFLDKDTFDSYIKKADIVVTHSGVGSIITSLKSRKPVIVFPRLRKYGEHVDDHQLDIATAFEKKNYVLCCKEQDDLLKLLLQCKEKKFEEYISQREQVVSTIMKYLESN